MPEANTWKYIENQFDSATQGSLPSLDKVVQDFDSKLTMAANEPGASPVLTTMVTDFTPVKNQWDKSYSDWQNASAMSKGSTVSFETLLSNLHLSPGPEQVSKIEQWDSLIRPYAPKGTSLYVTLLPQGRKPFSTGSYDEIINEVKNLATRLKDSGNPDLKTLGQGDVNDYYVLMKNARAKQQGLEGDKTQQADDITPARDAIVDELYGNLGLLMHLFRKNRDMIAGFFDLTVLRRTQKAPLVPVVPTPP